MTSSRTFGRVDMRAYRATGLFAGISETIDEVLGTRRFSSKTAEAALFRHGLGDDVSTLAPRLFKLLDHNWQLGPGQSHGRSLENFRWHHPQCYIAEGNRSPEVSLERALIGALMAAGRADWSNQVPLISGFGGHRAFRRRAVDLVRRHSDACFEFVELKIKSDTPIFAAMEILVYGLLWLLSRRDRQILGYQTNAILDATTLRLSVLAERTYYSKCPVGALSKSINEGLHEIAPRFGASMDFRFTAFPADFYWSSDPVDPRKPHGAHLIALLDGREEL